MNVIGCRRSKIVTVVCNACGSVVEQGGRCRVGLLCVSCRGKIASQKRARFSRARTVALARARDAGLLRRNRPGGRWSEKLLTLTVPHDARHTIGERIDLARRAWPHFIKSLNAHLRETNAHAAAQWYRSFEWTPATDGRGHPHFHVWFFGPFLDRDDLCAWWRDALRRAGYFDVPEVVIDVRAVANGDRGAYEVIKYLTKDLNQAGEKVDPELWARVYEALDGMRTTQGSRGFLKLADSERRCACGAAGCFSVSVRAVVDEGLPIDPHERRAALARRARAKVPRAA